MGKGAWNGMPERETENQAEKEYLKGDQIRYLKNNGEAATTWMEDKDAPKKRISQLIPWTSPWHTTIQVNDYWKSASQDSWTGVEMRDCARKLEVRKNNDN